MLLLILFGSDQPLKWCEMLPETSVKAPRRPHRAPEWLILFYSQLQAGSDQIHPLTQLALQPVERRNAATSSLCDIPHTIMCGPSAASHGRKLRKMQSSFQPELETVASCVNWEAGEGAVGGAGGGEKQQLVCWSTASQQMF